MIKFMSLKKFFKNSLPIDIVPYPVVRISSATYMLFNYN